MDGIESRTTAFEVVSPDSARQEIARVILEDHIRSDDETLRHAGRKLGAITLEEHQLAAVRRLRVAIREFGGALLCDPVGTGKTYVALAIASSHSRIAVVAPAGLRDMWLHAARTTAIEIRFWSFESLSRGLAGEFHHELLIVDEAHHVRNPSTRRFRTLSRLASQGDVLLLSATPIHNRRADLTVLLSLFLGERAAGLTNAELGRCVVRRRHRNMVRMHRIPGVESLRWCHIAEDDSIPAMILSLPPALPPRDGGDGGALVAHSLIRQWASSDAALEGGLRRRLQRAVALIAALEDGTYPSRQELAAWCVAEDSVQLAFAGIVSPAASGCAELLPVVRAHHDAVVELIAFLRRGSLRDAERADVIRKIRARHRGAPVVAFSQYADTVDALFHLLSPDGEVAVLSGSGGRVAGGSMTRSDILERFAPRASGRAPPRRAEVISLLLTTDLLSEGVNLQDAGVVVHIDLPWTPARMEQRLGRIARIGSRHDIVYAYALRPPASADMIAGMERALERKMREAGLVVDAFPSLVAPSTAVPEELTSTPRIVDESRLILELWLRKSPFPSHERISVPAGAAVCANRRGFLAACRVGGRALLIGCLHDRITDAPDVVLECLGYASGETRVACAGEMEEALQRLEAHVEASASLFGTSGSAPASRWVRRNTLRRISRVVSSSRPHLRPRITSLAERAREVVSRGFGAYAEQQLAALEQGEMSDVQWLETLIDFGSRLTRLVESPDARDAADGNGILAMIVFGIAERET